MAARNPSGQQRPPGVVAEGNYKITIPYTIERASKTQWQGKIYLPGGRVLELDPTTKGRCAKRLCTRLIPLLVAKIEATWPDDLDKPLTDSDIEKTDLPETTAAARDHQLKSLPPDAGEESYPPPIPPAAMPPIQHMDTNAGRIGSTGGARIKSPHLPDVGNETEPPGIHVDEIADRRFPTPGEQKEMGAAQKRAIEGTNAVQQD